MQPGTGPPISGTSAPQPKHLTSPTWRGYPEATPAVGDQRRRPPCCPCSASTAEPCRQGTWSGYRRQSAVLSALTSASLPSSLTRAPPVRPRAHMGSSPGGPVTVTTGVRALAVIRTREAACLPLASGGALSPRGSLVPPGSGAGFAAPAAAAPRPA